MIVKRDEFSPIDYEQLMQILDGLGVPADLDSQIEFERILNNTNSQLHKDIYHYCAMCQLEECIKQENLMFVINKELLDRKIWEAEQEYKRQDAEEKAQHQSAQSSSDEKLPLDYIKKNQELVTAYENLKTLQNELKSLEDKWISVVTKAAEEKYKIVSEGLSTRIQVMREARDNMELDLPVSTMTEMNRLLDESERLEKITKTRDFSTNPHNYLDILNDSGIHVNADMSKVEIVARTFIAIENQNKKVDSLLNDKIENYANRVNLKGEEARLEGVHKGMVNDLGAIREQMQVTLVKIDQKKTDVEALTNKKLDIKVNSLAGNTLLIDKFVNNFNDASLLSENESSMPSHDEVEARSKFPT